MLAAMTETPELQLAPDEAKAIAAAASNVSRHYDMRTTQKAADWAMLGIAIVGVYGPRVAVIAHKRRTPAVPQAQPAPAANGAAAPAETQWAADAFALSH